MRTVESVKQQILPLFNTPICNPTNDPVLQQNLAFEQVLIKLRRERDELTAIGQILYRDFGRLHDTNIDRLKVICAIWRSHRGIAPPPEDDCIPRSSKIQKPIAQWSIDAKRRLRLKKLHYRLRQKYSIPDLFHIAVQQDVVRNPNYYGVCILPSEFTCNWTPIFDPRQQAAIERENKLRAAGI